MSAWPLLIFLAVGSFLVTYTWTTEIRLDILRRRKLEAEQPRRTDYIYSPDALAVFSDMFSDDDYLQLSI